MLLVFWRTRKFGGDVFSMRAVFDGGKMMPSEKEQVATICLVIGTASLASEPQHHKSRLPIVPAEDSSR